MLPHPAHQPELLEIALHPRIRHFLQLSETGIK
jgi:hypothetical protein